MMKYRAHVRGYAKSIVVNATTLFPLTDPKAVAAKLKDEIKAIEDRAYRAGREDAQAEMRKSLGFR